MSTFTAAPGATGSQHAWVQNARARGSEETTPEGGGLGVDFIPTAEHAAGLDETETNIIGCLPDYRNGIMEIIRFIRNRRVTIGFPLVQNLLVNLTTLRGLVVKDDGGDNCRQWRRCIKC